MSEAYRDERASLSSLMLNWLSRIFHRPIDPLSVAQLDILRREVPFYSDLSNTHRELLHSRIALFLDQTPFEGCKGLTLTESMRLIVAAYACLLRLGHADDRYPDLRRVLIYPDDYLVPVKDADEAGIVTETDEWRSGESWQTGIVILSWREIQYDLRDSRDRKRGYEPHLYPARNLILHEFAHQLDFSYGLTSGIDEETGEPLADGSWNEALSDAYIRLDRDPANRRRPALDDYGAESPAELFAVAIESFFETPEELMRQYPELYAELLAFFNVEG